MKIYRVIHNIHYVMNIEGQWTSNHKNAHSFSVKEAKRILNQLIVSNYQKVFCK